MTYHQQPRGKPKSTLYSPDYLCCLKLIAQYLPVTTSSHRIAPVGWAIYGRSVWHHGSLQWLLLFIVRVQRKKTTSRIERGRCDRCCSTIKWCRHALPLIPPNLLIKKKFLPKTYNSLYDCAHPKQVGDPGRGCPDSGGPGRCSLEIALFFFLAVAHRT
ncbi:hypothetical protein BJX76DRAFT_1623 [Aspergillus varians]